MRGIWITYSIKSNLQYKDKFKTIIKSQYKNALHRSYTFYFIHS